MKAMTSMFLVAVQLGTLAGLAVTSPLSWPRPLAVGLFTAAGALGVWAVVTMRLQNLTPMPEPGEGRPLLTGGPYRWVRHPMYTSLLLFAAGCLVHGFTPLRAALAIVQVAVLAAKVRIEEAGLRRMFPEYGDYARRTRRFVPGLF